MDEKFGFRKAQAVGTDHPTAGTGKRGRVLLVDDEVFIVSSLKRLLGSEHDVTAVTNGFEAFTLIESGDRFDMILCDLRMPGMSGIDFYEKLQTVAPEMTSRVVFCTGATFSSYARQFFERIQNELLEKPFDPNVLRELVRRFVADGPSTRVS